MPPLRPTPPPRIRRVYMDDLTKNEGRNWMRRHLFPNEIADSRQLYQAFKCMVEKAARNMPEATGDNLVLRTYMGEEDFETTRSQSMGQFGPLNFRREVPHTFTAKVNSAFLAVVGTSDAVEELFSRDVDESLRGLWPIRYGSQGLGMVDRNGQLTDKYTVIFNELNAMGFLAECKLHAGIIPVPTGDMTPSPGATCPQN